MTPAKRLRLDSMRRLLLLGALLLPGTVPARETFSLDRGWRFRPGEAEPFDLKPAGAPVAAWQWVAVPGVTEYVDLARAVPPRPATGWKDAAPGQDVFHGVKGLAWFRTTLPDLPRPDRAIWFTSVDDDAVIFLNGRKLMEHAGWNDSFEAKLDALWTPGGPNELLILVGNSGGGPGGIHAAAAYSGPPSLTTPAAAKPVSPDKGWRRVDVPHDFVVEQTFTPTGDRSHGYLPKGIGWYRRSFTLPASARGQRVWLEFDGVWRDSAIWVNGALAGRHQSGYTSFHLDVTNLVKPGEENLVAVRCDANQNEGWWYEGGGIYRHVRLTILDPVHVDRDGVFVSTPVVGADRAVIAIRASVRNDSTDAATLRLRHTLESTTLTTERQITVAPGATVELTQTITLAAPRLWALHDPHRYRVTTELVRGDPGVGDTVTSPFGIRTIRFDPDRGFLLNGQPVKIKGTCNHQDFAGVGVALPDRLHEFKIEELKKWGVNAYRCSHHPPAPEILEACDRLGMLVMDENRHLGDGPAILGQVEAMVRRDRNHPSIVIWSTCNEDARQGTEIARKMGQAIREVINRHDGTRPVTSAMNQRGAWGKGLSLVQDVQGTNYNPEGYDEYHAAFPKQPMISTESHSTTTTRGIYRKDEHAGFESSFKEHTEYCWRLVAERPFVAGTFVWTGFDYRGEPTPYDWPCINSHFGFLDTCGFPKDDAFYYKAWWSGEPTVHVFPHWNSDGKEKGKPTLVRCYGNAGEVELFLNGKSQGVKPMPRWGHLDWEVPYVPGAIEVKGYASGRLTASHRIETTGPAAALRLTPDRKEIRADGEDVVLVKCEIVDAKGRIVPTAMHEVRFASKNGMIIGVGNGNPSSHEPDKATKRKAFNGLCLAIVQSTRTAGKIEITASANGLKPGRAVVSAAAAAALRPELPAD